MQEVSTMADDFYKLYCEEVEKNEKLVKENKYLKGRVRSLSSQLDYLMENQDKIIERKVNKQVDKITDAFENKITTMQKKIDNLNSILNNDSTNSGLPTSKTPLNKKNIFRIQERKQIIKRAVSSIIKNIN